MKQRVLQIMALFLSLLFLIFIVVIGFNRFKKPNRTSDVSYMKLLYEAYNEVNSKYVEKTDRDKISKSMVDGMLAALDPHSAYLPPEPYHEMEIQMSGSFGGVGIELGMNAGRLTVIAPIDDTPAQRAGIHSKDYIAKIDDKSTRGMSISDAVKLMRGEKGKPVTLTIIRGEELKPIIFNLIRGTIKISSIKKRTVEQGYGFVRIGQFQQRTGEEFREALKKLKEESGSELKGLVLDLRYNPGGLINSAIEVVNAFVGDDMNRTLVVSTKGRTPGANHEYHASLGTKEPHYPVVILINGGSASASEIVAGAMQDHRRAIIMGTQSFGKGSVQSIIPMKGNAALKLTTALYYTPSGRSIQAKGIVPDIVVENIKPLPQSSKPDEGLKEKDLENRLPAEPGKVVEKENVADKKPLPPSHAGGPVGDIQNDYQLLRALELMKSLNLIKAQGILGGRRTNKPVKK